MAGGFNQVSTKSGRRVMEELVRRIDRHYKAFKALSQPAYDGKKLQVVSIDPSWQSVPIEDTASIISATQRLGLKEVEENVWPISFMNYDLGRRS